MTGGIESEYDVTASGFVKGMTWAMVLMWLGMGLFLPLVIWYYEGEFLAALLMVVICNVTFVVIFLGSWAYSPSGYKVSQLGVTISRPAKALFIPVEEIEAVDEVEFRLSRTAKKFANSGIFSFSGSFYNKQEGSFIMYAKNSNFVRIMTRKKYIISPDERDQFILELRRYLEKAGHDGGNK